MKKKFPLGLLIMLFSIGVNAESKSLKGTRPNIILVMTDDQGMGELSCLGNTVIHTPNLDSFYIKSTRFTDFHVSPTCSPTRSAIMSGRHEFKNGVTHTLDERELMALSTTTFPQLLQNAGYKTGIFGKWHLGDVDAYQPYNRGFDEVFIHGAGGIGQSYKCSCGDFPPNKENPYFDNVILHNDTIVQTKGFCTDVFFQAALDWIKKQHDKGNSYFAYIPTNAPHNPPIAPDKYKKRFLDEGWNETVAGRYGMIENIDDNFGLLMQKLKEWDALENTLIIFITDNGMRHYTADKTLKNGNPTMLYNAHFKSGKGSVYEGGTHVPSFWYWKDILKKGVDISSLTAHIDFYKTFCDLAGVNIPDNIQKIDGRSLLPLLENPNTDWPDRKLFDHNGRWGKGVDPNEHKYEGAIRSQRWRMITFGGSEFKRAELFDISCDPYEDKDVASQHPEVIRELKVAYDQWWNECIPLMVNENRPNAKANPQAIRYQIQLEKSGVPEWTPSEF